MCNNFISENYRLTHPEPWPNCCNTMVKDTKYFNWYNPTENWHRSLSSRPADWGLCLLMTSWHAPWQWEVRRQSRATNLSLVFLSWRWPGPGQRNYDKINIGYRGLGLTTIMHHYFYWGYKSSSSHPKIFIPYPKNIWDKDKRREILFQNLIICL